MEIRYCTRSRFLVVCEDAIRTNESTLKRRITLNINLDRGGYNNRVLATIDASNHDEFDTNWNQKDPTRFPARIKAAATALHNCGCHGQYEITHNDGVLTIRKT